MGHISSEVTLWIRVLEKLTNHSSAQETACLLQTLKVHYHIHNSPPMKPNPASIEFNPHFHVLFL